MVRLLRKDRLGASREPGLFRLDALAPIHTTHGVVEGQYQTILHVPDNGRQRFGNCGPHPRVPPRPGPQERLQRDVGYVGQRSVAHLPVTIGGFRVIIEKRSEGEEPLSEATIMLKVSGHIEHTAATGNGPVKALDNAPKEGARAPSTLN